ncbi:phosphoenolpyruvate hydrolase family protein [Propionibacteriaceae bacterium Y1923]
MTLVGVGVGCGLTAAGAAAGGADLLACYSTAIYRAKGLPSALAFLPYDDPNELVRQVLPEVIAVARGLPVFAGVGAHDPRRQPDRLVAQMMALGATGVTNEPFVGIYDGDLRAQLEAAGLGYQKELDLARAAVNQGAMVLGWAWTPQEAAAMAATGASHVGLMVGITAGGRLGSEAALSDEQSHDLLAQMNAAVRRENPSAVTLIHGGPLHSVESVAAALAASEADGYLGGSSLERVPVIDAMATTVQEFKNINLKEEQ